MSDRNMLYYGLSLMVLMTFIVYCLFCVRELKKDVHILKQAINGDAGASEHIRKELNLPFQYGHDSDKPHSAYPDNPYSEIDEIN